MSDALVATFIGDLPKTYIYGSGGNTGAGALDSIFPDPYVHRVVWEYAAANSRKIYVDGVLWATDTTSRTSDLTLGFSEIGIQADGTDPFKGLIKDVVVYNVAMTSPTLAADMVPGANYVGISGATNWYKLDSDGTDEIGGEDMGVFGSSINYETWPTNREVANFPIATTQLAINAVHCSTGTLRSETPTVVPGQASPISTSGWTNLASVEWFNIYFVGDTGDWHTRAFHYIPTVGNGHVLFFGNGHIVATDWVNYGGDLIIKSALAAGYAVCAFVIPGYGTTDASNNGYGFGAGHDILWQFLNPGVANPIEFFYGPMEIAMNNLAGRYAKRSIIGLSGHGRMAVHYGALDARINHAILCFRGTVADRRRNNDPADFEQCILPNGYKEEDFLRLCAQGGRRFIELHHPTDSCCFGLSDYRDMTDYDTTFFGPIRAEFPQADTYARVVPTGSLSTHSFYQADWDPGTGVAADALSTPLNSVYYKKVVLAGTRFRGADFDPDDDGWADSIVYSPSLFLVATTYCASLVLAGSYYRPEAFTQHGLPAWADGLVYSAHRPFVHETISLDVVPSTLTLAGQTISFVEQITHRYTIVKGDLTLTGQRIHEHVERRGWHLLGEAPIITSLFGDSR